MYHHKAELGSSACQRNPQKKFLSLHASSNVVTVYVEPKMFENCSKLPSVINLSCGGAFLGPFRKDAAVAAAAGKSTTAAGLDFTVRTEVLLGTTVVLVEKDDGLFQPHRALLDSGSQVSQ